MKYIIKKEPINTLHIYDFDMTLYDHEKEDLIRNIVAELKNSLSNPQIRVILCTARTNKSEYIMSTEKLLNQNNKISPDEMFKWDENLINVSRLINNLTLTQIKFMVKIRCGYVDNYL